MISEQLARDVMRIVEDKKAQDVVVLNLKGICIMSDYFIMMSAESSVHMRTIAQELARKLREEQVRLLNPKDFMNDRWILMDFGPVVVHIFSEEARQFYQLERLWADARRTV